MLYAYTGQTVDDVIDIEKMSVSSAFDCNGQHVWSLEPTEGRTLLFADEFDEAGLDYDVWSHEIGYIRNNELQYYLAENVSVQDSNLVITAKREPYEGYDWTSGSIRTIKTQEFSRGRWAAKIKLPNVLGAFPAFWMRGNPSSVGVGGVYWPASGEIDIMEQMPGNAKYVASNLWKRTSGNFGSHHSHKINTNDWHIYALEWTSEWLDFYVDGVRIGGYAFAEMDQDEITAYKAYPFYCILNLAVGAAGGTPADTLNEMKMYVDWVRVYAAKD